ncbi:MAG TPA: hypothetical protein VK279_12150 [Solirubrobacteraceae bacterium]|nr:hypothetical protein [Solirubrobacteraceae bacterium]
MKENTSSGPGLLARVLAAVVLLIVAWLVLKFVIGLVTGIASIVVLVGAVIVVFWAIRTLR